MRYLPDIGHVQNADRGVSPVDGECSHTHYATMDSAGR